MSKLKDYTCNYGNGGEHVQEIGKALELTFPAVYTNAKDMALLAKAILQKSKSRFCYLPFCHTVEAEALGADINLGNEYTGPRAKTYTYNRLDELSALPEMNFLNGRIGQVIEACRILHSEGEYVALEICGPFTILNALMDIRQIIKGWRKTPKRMIDIFNNIGEQIICYMRESVRAGVTFFCYADPVGGLNILGPKLAEIVAVNFTIPFLLKSIRALDNKALIHLCPKTSLIITELGMAEWRDIDLSGTVSYEEACMEVCGSVGMVGEVCIQSASVPLENEKIRGIELTEDKHNIGMGAPVYE